MKLIKSTRQRSRAQAMVEFAIALPVLLALLYGILEAGRLLFIYSTIINASRQAVRYGSATGPGTDWRSLGGPNNTGVKRYQDCWGIRHEAQRVDFFNAFQDNNILITYDKGPGQALESFSPCDGNADTGIAPSSTNTTRVNVEIKGDYIPLVPKLVPFLIRSNTNTPPNPIIGISARSIIIKVEIEVTQPAPVIESTTTNIISDLPDPSKVGQAVAVTVTVAGTSTAPTGTVTITGADTNCTISLISGPGASNTGSCNVIFNSGGTKTLNATYSGDATHTASSDPDGETHTVLYPVTLNVTAAPDPATSGQNVTVTVTATSALALPNGSTVTISGASTNCTVTLNNGTGSCIVVFNTATTATINLTASYAGDADHANSTGSVDVDVILNKDTITHITSDTPDPSEIGQAVTVSVRVAGLTTAPTGTVTISGADTNCTITLANGVGSCNVIFNTPGGKTITATYSGSANHNPSSTSTGHAVNLQTTTTVITSHDPDPSTVTDTVTVTAAVTGGVTIPTGTISVTGASAPCTITLVNGSGSCTVTFASIGSKTLSATYNGDSTHATSNTTATHTVSIIAATPVPSCSGIIHGTISKSNNTMTMTITNQQAFPLTLGDLSVTWNNDRGHQIGSDKSLKLQSASMVDATTTTTFWTGNNIGPSLPITPSTTVTISANSTTTLTFTFDKTYDNFDGTEAIYINLSTPGCESNPISAP